MQNENREYVGDVTPEEIAQFEQVQIQEEALRRTAADFQWGHMQARKSLMADQHAVWEQVAGRLGLDIRTTNYNIERQPDGTSKVYKEQRGAKAA